MVFMVFIPSKMAEQGVVALQYCFKFTFNTMEKTCSNMENIGDEIMSPIQ